MTLIDFNFMLFFQKWIFFKSKNQPKIDQKWSMVSKIIRKWLRKRFRKTFKNEPELPFAANFWHFWNFEKWKFLINDSLPELFLIRIREFGMRPQAIWMFYNHSVLNLSFLRLIVKRTKTKKSRFSVSNEVYQFTVEKSWRTSWRTISLKNEQKT